MTKRNDSNSTLLIALVLIFTFPVWIALFGVAVGLMGAAIGIVAGVFGAVIGVIFLPFKLLFGWGHWGWGWDIFPHMHHGRFIAVVLIIIVALIVRNRRTA